MDQYRIRFPIRSWSEHLRAALEWLGRAQEATRTGILSAGYSLMKPGWLPGYPEISGYTIPTFLDYGEWAGDYRWEERACAIGDGLIRVQDPEGFFRGGFISEKRGPSVFNSGQILMGFTRLYRKTSQEDYGRAAERIARWLVSNLDRDGAWRRFAFLDRVHTYYTMVAWALLDWGEVASDPSCEEAARRHVEWVMDQRRPNGWFDHMSFDAGHTAFTHTIGYTLQGLLQCARTWNDAGGVAAVRIAAEALRERFLRDGRLAGWYGDDWRPTGEFSCLTGDCQVALVWLDLGRMTAEAELEECALGLLRRVAGTQDLESPSPRLRGAIKGSDPIWGEYQPYTFPSWAAKFFCDALLVVVREEAENP